MDRERGETYTSGVDRVGVSAYPPPFALYIKCVISVNCSTDGIQKNELCPTYGPSYENHIYVTDCCCRKNGMKPKEASLLYGVGTNIQASSFRF